MAIPTPPTGGKTSGLTSRMKQARPAVSSPRGSGPYGWRPSSGQKPSTGWNTSPTGRPNLQDFILPRVPGNQNPGPLPPGTGSPVPPWMSKPVGPGNLNPGVKPITGIGGPIKPGYRPGNQIPGYTPGMVRPPANQLLAAMARRKLAGG